jgi:hypothetical protein
MITMGELVDTMINDLGPIIDKPGLASFGFKIGNNDKAVVQFVPKLEALIESRESWTPRELIEAIMENFEEDDIALEITSVN